MEKKFTLGIIGAGNMASAILGGILKGGILKAEKIAVSDKDSEKLAIMAQNGVYVTHDNREIASESQYVIFAVKPQIAPVVFEEIKEVISAGTVVSIMAGISIAKLKNALGERNYARIMPNTPALAGEGMSAVAFSEGYRSQFVLDVFASVGKVVELDESLFDAVTSLSGSGPAYVYMFAAALTKAGIEGGLSPEESKLLALQTIEGSAAYAKTAPFDLETLTERVCSKGGTTIEAVNVFKKENLDGIVSDAVRACRNRSAELSEKS